MTFKILNTMINIIKRIMHWRQNKNYDKDKKMIAQNENYF